MSTTSKGNRIEKLLDDWLNKNGFVTHRARKNVYFRAGRYWATRNDIFGCFDIMAKDMFNPTNTFYFQVSTNWKYSAARKELEAFPAGSRDLIIMARKLPRQPFEYKLRSGMGWVGLNWIPKYRLFMPDEATK